MCTVTNMFTVTNTITFVLMISLSLPVLFAQGMFTVWGVGLLLALLTFSLEIVVANAFAGRAPHSSENVE